MMDTTQEGPCRTPSWRPPFYFSGCCRHTSCSTSSASPPTVGSYSETEIISGHCGDGSPFFPLSHSNQKKDAGHSSCFWGAFSIILRCIEPRHTGRPYSLANRLRL
ncbi:hypothetical protein GOP47_0027445 [Adiantum capillus-veneris]|nr:hypothetical protein GOP47_0027445 [Adiantum capillus-veneris]